MMTDTMSTPERTPPGTMADTVSTSVPVGAIGGAVGVAIVLAALSLWGGSASPGPLLVVGIEIGRAHV